MPDDSMVRLGSEAPTQPFLAVTVNPTTYAAPAQFSDALPSDELEMLYQLAAELLEDPLAVQRLSDRVLELMQQDLTLQRERDRGYGRRW